MHYKLAQISPSMLATAILIQSLKCERLGLCRRDVQSSISEMQEIFDIDAEGMAFVQRELKTYQTSLKAQQTKFAVVTIEFSFLFH